MHKSLAAIVASINDEIKEHNKQYWLYDGHPIRQLLADIGCYERAIKRAEKNGVSKADINLLWMELVTKKTILKNVTSKIYEPKLDVRRKEKELVGIFFNSLDGFTWRNQDGWLGQTQTMTRLGIEVLENPVNLFNGIDVEKVKSEDRNMVVSSMHLSGEGLFGQLPPSLTFKDCKQLDISFNLLHGPLPSLQFMRQLTVLDLSGNMLTGSINLLQLDRPLEALTTLNLSNNELEGRIPDFFTSFPQLTSLDLSGNCLSGPIPRSLTISVPGLRCLHLQRNKFTGSIPLSWACIQSLRQVNLSHNQFTDGVSAFDIASSLESLQLQYNQLRGQVQPSIINLKRISVIYMQNNSISGLLPDELCQLRTLRLLDLSHNRMRGILPYDIGLLTSLEVLRLEGNAFLGPVPRSLAQLSKLRDMTIFRPYPADWTEPQRRFDMAAFLRVYADGPKMGIDSVHWDFEHVYGRVRNEQDDESVTIFSGGL